MPASTISAQGSLEDLRRALAPAIAEAAAFDGWSSAALEAAAASTGTDPALVRLAFADGPMDMIAAWIASVDAAMEHAWAGAALDGLSVRERIRRLVTFRLDAVAGREEALRRALAIMAMPQNAPRALQLGWQSADAMWRLAGDRATDYNHYTKRAILAGVYAATLAVFIDDKSADKAETAAFLDRRLADIVRFEKAKAKVLRPNDEHFSLARFLGRLRYPSR